MTNRTIDLNSDLGEGYGPWTMGDDEALMDVVTSVNVACGGHAGDPSTMARTVAAAGARGLGIGAHPSFADAIERFLERESGGIDEYMDELNERNPFRALR